MPDRRQSVLHMVLAVWGHAYIATFLRFCVPTLLAEGNAPALRKDLPHRLRIFTPPDDAASMRREPALQALEQHVAIEFVPIAVPGEAENKYHVITRTHLQALTEARKVGAAVVFLSPDFMLSDGTLRALTVRPYAAVVMVSPRVRLEGMSEALAPLRTSDPACPIRLAPRALMTMALQNLHAVTLSQFWDAPGFSRWPSILYWRADDATLIAHCIHPHPILIDPARLDARFASDMNSTIDGDLLGSLRAPAEDRHVVCESDEFLILELSGPQMRAGLDGATTPASPEAVADFGRRHANATNRALLGYRLWYRAGPGDPAAQAATAARADAVLADLNRRMAAAPGLGYRLRGLAARVRRRLRAGLRV